MFQIVDRLIEKQSLVLGSSMAIAILVAVSLVALMVQNDRAGIATRIQSTYSSQASQNTGADNPNAITNAFSNISANTVSVIDLAEAKILSGTMSSSTAIVHSEKAVAHGFYTAETRMFTNAVSSSIGFIHLEDAVAHSFYMGSITTLKVERKCLTFPIQFASNSFSFSWNILGQTYGSIINLRVPHLKLPGLRLPSLNSIVRPQDNYAVPVITPMQLKQAAIIQSGTTDVVLPSTSSGTGGACDSGGGNGGYPMSWCNSRMDLYQPYLTVVTRLIASAPLTPIGILLMSKVRLVFMSRAMLSIGQPHLTIPHIQLRPWAPLPLKQQVPMVTLQ